MKHWLFLSFVALCYLGGGSCASVRQRREELVFPKEEEAFPLVVDGKPTGRLCDTETENCTDTRLFYPLNGNYYSRWQQSSSSQQSSSFETYQGGGFPYLNGGNYPGIYPAVPQPVGPSGYPGIRYPQPNLGGRPSVSSAQASASATGFGFRSRERK